MSSDDTKMLRVSRKLIEDLVAEGLYRLSIIDDDVVITELKFEGNGLLGKEVPIRIKMQKEVGLIEHNGK